MTDDARTPTPDDDAIREALVHIARDQLGWSRPLPEASLSEALDSVDRLAFVVAIEDHFLIAFDPEDDARVDSVDDLVATIRRLLDAR